ncbi:MAG: hypothetical protein DCF19_23325 [Pseudanabaena frigida]|uniref:Uncharacterized protein n=1 Tax=Pseudanabaena frigida TaxID=945775 RepID=A0A2W4XM87_9CYAN|nr:MAG: hypothetical protein DCF19_23325 [Pseudanabaena frigida]
MRNNPKNLSTFQQIFFTVVALTLLSGAGSIALASQSNLSPQQNDFMKILNTTWSLGVGAVFGLLGGAEPPKPGDKT